MWRLTSVLYDTSWGDLNSEKPCKNTAPEGNSEVDFGDVIYLE